MLCAAGAALFRKCASMVGLLVRPFGAFPRRTSGLRWPKGGGARNPRDECRLPRRPRVQARGSGRPIFLIFLAPLRGGSVSPARNFGSSGSGLDWLWVVLGRPFRSPLKRC
ncbi:uncharacterized protein TM35_000221850 [Trypanosoma theileri]|uniref:Uncharacterized protein n=1 Tax=Trypanosoma theileri TaxID=67003 RepID=A0A1X0NRP7_9TRYP|nr:uncharacterized protein TM35_000221850 [Trypanosoma theileri]ORC87386.1 hypothetical protein TM35_000221850 [Trypanosoma theileri]